MFHHHQTAPFRQHLRETGDGRRAPRAFGKNPLRNCLAIVAGATIALTACGSNSEGGEEIEPSTSPAAATTLQPGPTTSDSSPPPGDTTPSTAATTSTTASTSPASTSNATVPPTESITTPVSTVGQQGPVVGIRLDDNVAIFGVAVLDEVDVQATIDTVADALGSPTSMTEWAAMPEPLAAIGVQDFREAWWSDLRLVFERTDGVARLSSWNLGASPISGCFPPTPVEPEDESMVVTDDGIGIGSDVEVVAARYFLVNRSTDEATIVNVNPISLSFDNDMVIGISQSRADCFSDSGDQ